MSASRHSALVADARRAFGDGFTGRCIGRDDEEMNLAHKQHAAKLPLHLPELLVRCQTPQDVVRAFDFIRDKAVSFSVRSGGHCFADLSNRGEVIIDCGDLNGFGADGGDSIIAGPGALSGDVVDGLLPAGMTVPVGGCPLVALGGLSMVGGFGLTGRLHGILSDRLSAAHVLLADGNMVECDVDQNSDLLWAIAGAGPLGFGIVTQIRLDAAPLHPGVALEGVWPIARTEEIFALWQSFAPLADNAVSLQISLMAPEDPDEPCFVRFYGVILDIEGPGEDGLEPLLAAIAGHFGPYARQINITGKSAHDISLYACGRQTYHDEPAWLPSRPYGGTALLAQRSQFFDDQLPVAAISALIERLQADRTMLQAREIECIPWGGNYARQNEHSCFSHRQAHMLLRYNSLTGRRPGEAICASMQRWVDDCRDMLRPYANNRIYAGYAERDLSEPMAAYFGDEAARLAALKRRYDPDNFFMGYGV